MIKLNSIEELVEKYNKQYGEYTHETEYYSYFSERILLAENRLNKIFEIISKDSDLLIHNYKWDFRACDDLSEVHLGFLKPTESGYRPRLENYLLSFEDYEGPLLTVKIYNINAIESLLVESNVLIEDDPKIFFGDGISAQYIYSEYSKDLITLFNHNIDEVLKDYLIKNPKILIDMQNFEQEILSFININGNDINIKGSVSFFNTIESLEIICLNSDFKMPEKEQSLKKVHSKSINIIKGSL